MTIRTLEESLGYTGQAADELEEITDGIIVVSYNTVRADGEVCRHRYSEQDDWHVLPPSLTRPPAAGASASSHATISTSTRKTDPFCVAAAA